MYQVIINWLYRRATAHQVCADSMDDAEIKVLSQYWIDPTEQFSCLQVSIIR